MLPMVLISLDGWGHSDRREGNAIAHCGGTAMPRLASLHPSTLLDASGESVGLPAGQMGNSEVGHMCMGAGRVVLQDLLRITRAFEDGTALANPALAGAMDRAAAGGGTLHLMGLLSGGGVHSHVEHAKGLVRMARRRGLRRVVLHAFLDGRDTPPRSALNCLQDMERLFQEEGIGAFGTVMGRYYAMDRDNRWERTERAWRCMVLGDGFTAPDAAAALSAAYARGEDDEFVKPTVIVPGAPVRDGDAVVFFNFRADRARQITRAFTQPGFDRFSRPAVPALSSFVCMTTYDETFDLPAAFPARHPDKVLGEVLSVAGLRQLRIAETEKYAHVTFFFNGGEEKAFPGEERILIPSPKVATYDRQPEMSAPDVTAALVQRLKSGPKELVVILNFANADMVGHTGVYEAALSACRVVDDCVGTIASAVSGMGGAVIVTADHGNAEQMIDPATGGPHTAHTLNPVPFILGLPGRPASPPPPLRRGGTLADVAPTLLALLGLPQPAEMTGRDLRVL
ncbi:MAG TPA: 2,3-bisphosphoglycerate-independent phosphoglycerate mutase [Candidatus Polarisedimenticolia bacterium]|nr:2,3-bisphosphoglycerate-independent phosphoglycerate mutase [Candidatus Polarisedimenticolia bacterium]